MNIGPTLLVQVTSHSKSMRTLRRLFPWNDSGGEDATDAAAVGPPRVGIAAAPAVVGDVCRAGGGGALSLPLGLRKSLESKGRECECM